MGIVSPQCLPLTLGMPMKARQVVILEPGRVGVREVELPNPASHQILVATEASAVSAGTELAVYTGSHQWLKDPNLPDWKFPFRPGYSAAGQGIAVGSEIRDCRGGGRCQLPGKQAPRAQVALRPVAG